MMSKKSIFYVKKRTLLLIAGIVWVIAGINVARLGLLAYFAFDSVNFLHILLSLLVFLPFSTMFFFMHKKHVKRIKNYIEPYQLFLKFFDLKAYGIMIFMMGGGIFLRNSGWVSNTFIGVFYTGLGFALTLAGILFIVACFKKNFHEPFDL